MPVILLAEARGIRRMLIIMPLSVSLIMLMTYFVVR
jgi:hypothetical protein